MAPTSNICPNFLCKVKVHCNKFPLSGWECEACTPLLIEPKRVTEVCSQTFCEGTRCCLIWLQVGACCMSYGTKKGVLHSLHEQWWAKHWHLSHECYLTLFLSLMFVVTKATPRIVYYLCASRHETNKRYMLMHTSGDGSRFTGTGYLGSQLTCCIRGRCACGICKYMRHN